MGFLKRLFSAPDVIERTVDAVYNGADQAWFTPEERAKATEKAQEIYAELWKAAVPSAISRRIIAIQVTTLWSLLVLLVVIQGGYWGSGEGSAAAFTLKVLVEIVLQPFSIIVGFYFLAQVVTNFTKK